MCGGCENPDKLLKHTHCCTWASYTLVALFAHVWWGSVCLPSCIMCVQKAPRRAGVGRLLLLLMGVRLDRRSEGQALVLPAQPAGDPAGKTHRLAGALVQDFPSQVVLEHLLSLLRVLLLRCDCAIQLGGAQWIRYRCSGCCFIYS